jgi:cell division protein FtsQ
MSEERKISSKKVLRFAVGALLVAVFMVALVAASRQQNSKTIKGMEVHLNDENEFSFLQKKDIETLLLKNRHINLSQTAIAELDLRMMEDVARTNPWVAKADIFVDNRQILQVNILQREPVARIFDVNGNSCYMDSALNVMPVSEGYTFPAPVFTNVPFYRNDSIKANLYEKIAYLSKVIGADTFWNAQVTQIEVQPDQTFVLIPLFGDQRILLGDTANVHEKLGHLLAFYKNVPAKVGWDKYEVLDVRFKNQVIASPSIGWIPPKVVDTTIIAEGPDPKAPVEVAAAQGPVVVKPATATTTVKPVMPAVAKPVKPATVATANVAKPKVVPKPVVAKPKEVKANVVKVVPPKAKSVVQASAKPKDKKKEVADKKKTTKDKTKTQSPKYIYPGKNSGNH